MTKDLEPLVKSKLQDRDMYAFTRATHITLARAAGVHPDAVNAQVGHTGGTVEETYYLDQSLLDPGQSSRAVYDLITGRRRLGKAAERAEAKPVRRSGAARARARPRAKAAAEREWVGEAT